jgi:predicted RNase H-like HicB family nuclease
MMNRLHIELEQEVDRRWIAEIPAIPGAMAYGTSREEAVMRVRLLAAQIQADANENSDSKD